MFLLSKVETLNSSRKLVGLQYRVLWKYAVDCSSNMVDIEGFGFKYESIANVYNKFHRVLTWLWISLTGMQNLSSIFWAVKYFNSLIFYFFWVILILLYILIVSCLNIIYLILTFFEDTVNAANYAPLNMFSLVHLVHAL